ncbi:MAG: acyltransferase [Gammaproteobacteria bacterium]|nr:acyltransferase [Gammaproteobacteria bacterium]
MNKTTSIYLDIVRFLAAIVVFFVHANYERFTGGELPFIWRISHLGNDAVMVFFVLSGFVITYVANTKEKTIDEYFISRFSRLYSVVLPAIFVTVFLDFIGSNIDFSVYDGPWYQSDMPLVRIVANLFFINELWFSSIRPFSNGPFWSIGYEFWYYVLFAIIFYLKTPLRPVLFLFVCLLVGPKILLLAPVWLFGVIAYYVTLKKNMPEFFGWILLIISTGGYLLYRLNGGHEYILDMTKVWLGEDLYKSLSWSRYFLSSYIVGTFITLNFIAVSIVSHRISFLLNAIESPVRYLASYTFVLYLLHYPLLQFFSAATKGMEPGTGRAFIIVMSSLFIVWVLGYFTERKKYSYKLFFKRVLVYAKTKANKV